MQRPFICHSPKNAGSPIIFNNPHSGRIYNGSFLRQAVLNFKQIRISEDFYVDQLLESVTKSGSFLLEACFPRSFVDVNRSPHDLDEKLIANLNSADINPRTAAGLGVIPRIVGDGIELYDTKLNLDEVNFRLDTCFFPYHKKLKELIGRAVRRFGGAILFDVHSMPHSCLESSTDRRCSIPQVVLGDCFGSSCGSKLSQKVFDIFVSQGFNVKRNSPFSGGFITKNYGLPNQNVQAIQIEIDRSLYMDEKNFMIHDGFFELKKKLQHIFHLLSITKDSYFMPFRASLH